MPKSHHDVKREAQRKKNPNTITDSDYFFRDKAEEAKNGYPNTIDMTPPEPKPVKKAAAKED